MKFIISLLLIVPVAGCVSFSSSESATPDCAAFCENKEAQCRDICGAAGMQTFSCKAAPREGLDLKCECKKPAAKGI